MNKRIIGIDILRVVSMLGIVILHLLKESSILDFNPDRVRIWSLAWVLEIISFSSVNVFAMISGYVGYGRKHGYGRLVSIYLQVLFFQAVFYIIGGG